MYGIIVGISCLMALGLILGVYHYIIMQNQIGTLAASYESIVRLEAFQLPLRQAQNLSMLGSDANIDYIRVYTVKGVVTAIGSENLGFYSVV